MVLHFERLSKECVDEGFRMPMGVQHETFSDYTIKSISFCSKVLHESLEDVRAISTSAILHNCTVLDEIWKAKLELDGIITEEEEKAIIKVKGEALKEKDDPGAFIFPIRLEGKVNENALADTGSDINIMPYWIYEKLGIEEIKKVSDLGYTNRPRVAMPRPPRASMQDLYDRMGSMEIRQEATERIEYMQSYYWDRYAGVFEHMAGMYDIPVHGAYNPPGYAQPQYDQYYQQYPFQPPQYPPQQQQQQ
ncbi:hypothetical protein Tco_0988179 [Tanacetum coccineum]|uniref:Uncharacterized protein n=1 Tax=Tanacetum coccineum TaxID=301880 RepID=A0ABQ5EQA6_9ASTR